MKKGELKMEKKALGIILILPLISILTLAFNLQSASADQIYFSDEASNAGVDYSGASRGVAFADYDSDGHLDLYVTYVAFASTALFRNNGNATFTDVTSIANVGQSLDARGLSFADYDNDGDLDLFIADTQGSSVIFFKNNGNGTFSDATSGSGFTGESGGTDVASGDYDNDGDLDIYMIRWDSVGNVLYQNNGDGTFSDVTATAGVGDTGSASGVASADYDNDGDLDILINKSNREADVLYRNNGDGTFINVADIAGINSPGYGEAVVFGDYDNDGDIDVYLGEGGASPGVYSHLFCNNGDGTFTDVTDISGMGGYRSTDAVFFDYDNDGDLDIMASQWNIGNYLWRNNGDGTFTDVAVLVGVRWHSRGDNAKLAIGDYDNDGDLDIFGAAWNEANFLYQNNGSTNNWLKIELEGIISNKNGIGAKIKVIAGHLTQIREMRTDIGGENQQSLSAHFGLGALLKADLIEVIWPSGTVQVIQDIGANQKLTIQEIGIELCEGDFDGDGDVDGSDLAVFAADFGRTDCGSEPPCEGDFDGDDDVDGSDLAVFAADFGRTDCP